MNANSILFGQVFNGEPFFKNQQDLVQQLLATPSYLVKGKDENEHQKAQGRLKTYISQLLSDTAIRSITEDFKKALFILLRKKIGVDETAESILQAILRDLELKNSITKRVDNKQTSLFNEIANATYISIITAKPLEEDIYNSANESSLINLFFNDLMKVLYQKDGHLKYYRFNFPMTSHCDLFWMGFKYLLHNELRKLIDNEAFIFNLYEKFTIKSPTLTAYENYKRRKDETNEESVEDNCKMIINNLAEDIIELLNRNKLVVVYHDTEPIYSVPIIALNPDNFSSAKVYSIIEDENRNMKYFKTSQENTYLWKIFVWDKIKVSKISKDYPCPTLRL